jgi:ubiquitin C-terminal hydrolase
VSEAGHYTSYIRTDTKKWNYFDDEKISDFDLSELGAESFGGIEENPFGDDEEKKKNAYLLFYEKVKRN